VNLIKQNMLVQTSYLVSEPCIYNTGLV